MPQITPHTTAVVGKFVSLRCQSQSNSIPAYHSLSIFYSWWINNTAILQSDTRYNVTNDEILINMLEYRDKYNRYSCTAAEEKGLKSDPAVHMLDLICMCFPSH